MNKKPFIIGIIIAAIITILFSILLPDGHGKYEQIFKKSITKQETLDSTLFYRSFQNGLIRISKDGASYYNLNGELIWIKSFNMKNPIYSTKGKYFTIADRGGNDILIFDKNGVVGEGKTNKVIQQVSIAKTGHVYVILEDEDFSYIHVLDKKCNIKDISIKCSIEGEGFPLDLSVSNDATELVVSYGYINENNTFSSKVVFYNFDEVGKNISADRVVGTFKNEYNQKYVARVNFSDNDYAQTFYDGGLDFYSTKVLTKTQLIQKKEFDKKIKSIDFNENIEVIVLDDGETTIFDKKSNEMATIMADSLYTDFYISNDYLVFQKGNKAQIFSKNGNKIFDGEIIANAIRIEVKSFLFFTDLYIGTNKEIYKLRIK